VLREVASGSASPGGEWALITRAGRSTFVRGLSGLPEESPVDGLIDAIDGVAWSRDGRFALLRSSSSSQLQRVRLFDAEALADAAVSFPPESRLVAMTIDPSGGRMAVVVAGSGLYLFGSGQSPALLSSMEPAALTFDNTGRRLYAADLEAQRIFEFDSGSGPLEFASLPDSSRPSFIGLAVSGDGSYLMVTESGAPEVRLYETASRTLAKTIPLDFAPSRLEPVSPAPTFLLNSGTGNEWLLLLDGSHAPAVYFIPVSREEPL
jgi:sugar lactone lactonase YvrE